MSHQSEKTNPARRRNFLKYLLLGAALAGGLGAGYNIIGVRAGAARNSVHSIAARATNVPSTPLIAPATATAVWATRTPVPGDLNAKSADMASLQAEMEQLERRVTELMAPLSGEAGVADTTVVKLQQMLDASAASLAYMDALIAQQAKTSPTSAPTAAKGGMGEMSGGRQMGQGAPSGDGLHGHH